MMAAEKLKVLIVAFVLVLIGIGICFFILNEIERRGYDSLPYDQAVETSISSKADYTAIVARNTIEVGFLQEGKRTRLVFYQLFFSDDKIKGLDCRDGAGRFKCYQHIDIRKGDTIFKKSGDKVLCTVRTCYLLVPEERKAELGE